MIVISEKKRLNETYYSVLIKEGKRELSSFDIDVMVSEVDKDDFEYLLIYGKDMQLYEIDFSFLNYFIATQSINSRLKARQALKLLHCFEYIVNKTVYEFNQSDIENLKRFLNGIAYTGRDYSFDLISSRSNKTINEYLSVYRSYLSYTGNDAKHPLFNVKISTTKFSYDDVEIKFKRPKYKSSAKTTDPNEEVPKYISVEDFNNIINVIRKDFVIRDECIVRLMYENGLRIGEVLGLTNDDLVEGTYVDPETAEIKYANFVYLRNRVSDKKYQRAKGCMKVQSRKQYRTRDYKMEDNGFQRVAISSELYNLIVDYIEEAHISARNNLGSEYYTICAADRVRISEPYEEDNFYIFLNTQGHPLSQQCWNSTLKKIFTECGIHIDQETKKDNLNHRFRHGFAMFKVKYRGFKEIELRDALRHRSVSSVQRYFRPTSSDKIKVKTEFTEDLYEMIPILKGNTGNTDEDK